tara:strand:+ start:2278 stop:2904 length:627 start_codon:yes stop_codon:yes gene_type:complete
MKINHVITNVTNTPFDNKHVRALIDKYVRRSFVKGYQTPWLVDPFARESLSSKHGDYRHLSISNDLNPSMPTDYHMEANEFLVMLSERVKSYRFSCQLLLFDPPYTLRMLKDHYIDEHMPIDDMIPLWQTQNMWGKGKDAINQVCPIGAYAISFGYHTHGMGRCRGWRKEEILILEQAGSPDRYDVLVTVEKKVQSSLSDYAVDIESE